MPNGWGGKKLMEIRDEFEITLSRLAKEADVSSSTISRVEKGKTHAKQETKMKILKALNSISGKNYKLEDLFPDGEESK